MAFSRPRDFEEMGEAFAEHFGDGETVTLRIPGSEDIPDIPITAREMDEEEFGLDGQGEIKSVIKGSFPASKVPEAVLDGSTILHSGDEYLIFDIVRDGRAMVKFKARLLS